MKNIVVISEKNILLKENKEYIDVKIFLNCNVKLLFNNDKCFEFNSLNHSIKYDKRNNKLIVIDINNKKREFSFDYKKHLLCVIELSNNIIIKTMNRSDNMFDIGNCLIDLSHNYKIKLNKHRNHTKGATILFNNDYEFIKYKDVIVELDIDKPYNSVYYDYNTTMLSFKDISINTLENHILYISDVYCNNDDVITLGVEIQQMELPFINIEKTVNFYSNNISKSQLYDKYYMNYFKLFTDISKKPDNYFVYGNNDMCYISKCNEDSIEIYSITSNNHCTIDVNSIINKQFVIVPKNVYFIDNGIVYFNGKKCGDIMFDDTFITKYYDDSLLASLFKYRLNNLLVEFATGKVSNHCINKFTEIKNQIIDILYSNDNIYNILEYGVIYNNCNCNNIIDISLIHSIQI